MDCHDSIHQVLGSNKFGRIQVELEMKDDESHFSFEQQSLYQVDIAMTIVYGCLVALFFKERLRFAQNFESLQTPHFYNIIAMVF